MIRAILLLAACIALVAYLGNNDIEHCINAGVSPENCYATYNP